MFSLFRRKSMNKSKDFETPKNVIPNGDTSQNLASHHRYSHYSSSVTSGRESPPRIVLYSRPPENLTSPYRESSPDPQQDLVQEAPIQTYPHHHHHQSHPQVPRKYSRQSRNGVDASQDESNSSKVIVVRRTKSSGGPISFLRKSFRKHSVKKLNLSSHPTSLNGVSNGTPQRNGSREKVLRKFSDPYHASPSTTTAASSSKLLPGRASSPRSLITLKPVVPQSSLVNDNMYNMIVPDSNYSHLYNNMDNGEYVGLSSNTDDFSKRRSIAVAPSHNYSIYEPSYLLPTVQEDVTNGHPSQAPSRVLPRPPSNLGVPYFPPPPQTVSAVAEHQPTVRKISNQVSKVFSGQNVRPLRISLRSKVRKIVSS